MNINYWDSIITNATVLGDVEITILFSLLLSIWLLLKRKRKEFIWMNLVIYGGIVLNLALKLVFNRERPGEERMLEVFGYTFEVASYSFPSGHTMRITLLVLFIGYLLLNLFALTFQKLFFVISIGVFLVFIVAYSRVYLDYHYISDSIAAIIISVIFFSGMLLIRMKMMLPVYPGRSIY
ncbi:phosphatase PAP2 family protein [Alkalicoccus luteus]|uniref:phosphatase PAP2 family protein n=1 Tax=Alkalicoccus luteus TaxID=1237094 RepID=UPI004034C5DB